MKFRLCILGFVLSVEATRDRRRLCSYDNWEAHFKPDSTSYQPLLPSSLDDANPEDLARRTGWNIDGEAATAKPGHPYFRDGWDTHFTPVRAPPYRPESQGSLAVVTRFVLADDNLEGDDGSTVAAMNAVFDAARDVARRIAPSRAGDQPTDQLRAALAKLDKLPDPKR